MFDEIVDIIVPCWNNRELTEKCFECLRKNTKHPYRLIIINNGSDQDTTNYLQIYAENHPENTLYIYNDINLGFTKAINQGLKASEPNRYKVLLNNDTEVPVNWLTNMRKLADLHPNVGMVGPMNTSFDEVQYWGTANKMRESILRDGTFKMLSFFCVLIKPTVIQTIGYLDEGMEMFCSDDAYCKKAVEMKFSLVIDFKTTVKHYHRASCKKRKGIGQIYDKDYKYLIDNYFRNVGKKVYLAVLNQGWINARFFTLLPQYLQDRRFRFTYQISSRKPITNNRNQIRTDFLKTDCEILWYMDSCIWPPDDILNVLLYNKDIIALPCPLWSDSDQGSWVSYNCGYEDGDLTRYPSAKEQVGLQEIDRIGTGCMFITREVMEKIKAPFLIDYDENGHMTMGLDFRFCDLARKMGYKVWTHWGYQCDHRKEVWLLDVMKYGANCVRKFCHDHGINIDEVINANRNGVDSKV